MKSIISVILILGSLRAFAGGGSSIGLGNPASENCITMGGQIELIDSQAGQYEICVIEEWNLFTQMIEQNLTIEHHYNGHSMPNPASVNCTDIGGELRIVETLLGQAGYCAVEEWALYNVFHPAY